MTRQFILCILVILFTSTTAFAQAPGMIPVQGTLVDATGAPLDGSYLFTLTLYDDAAGTNVVATEAQTVIVSGGYFTAFFGATGPIDPSTFRDNGDLYLGLAIDSDPEMQPLFTIGTSPWAGYSEYAGEADDAVLLGGQPASAYRLATDPIDFSLLTGVPAETDPVFGASPAAGITASDMAAWSASETDQVFGASPAAGITTSDMAAWSASETDPVFGASPASGITTSDMAGWSLDADTLGALLCLQDEVAQWDGFAWVCTSTSGLLAETDPLFGASAAAGISSSDVAAWSLDADTLGALLCVQDEIARWDGFAWVCTSTSGLLAETDPLFGASAAAGISSSDVADWSLDDDTLGGLLCGSNEVPMWDGFAWTCTSTNGLIVETDPAFGASPAATISNADIVSWNTPSDTLAGLSCSNGQVAQWSTSLGQWLCATVTGSGTETDPVWTAFQGSGGTISGSVTATAFVGNGSGLTGLTDNDTLGGLSCSNGQVAQWNGSNWVCANVASATEADPVWGGFQSAGGTIGGAVTVSGNNPGFSYDPPYTNFVYTTWMDAYASSGSNYFDWKLSWEDPGVGAGDLMKWDGQDNRLEVGGAGIHSGSLTLGGQSLPGLSFDPTTSTVGYSMYASGYALSGVDYADLVIARSSSFGGSNIFEYSDNTSTWDFSGAVTSDCPEGTDEASGWCIENLGAGAASVPTPATWPTAVANCDGKGMQLCPLAALMACDQLEPTTTGCEDATDGTGGTYDLWTSDVQVPTGGGNAYSNLVTFDSSNGVDLEAESNSNNWLCCTPVYSP